MENTLRSLKSLATILPETLVPAGVGAVAASRPRTSQRSKRSKASSRASRTRAPTAVAVASRPVSIFNGVETIPNLNNSGLEQGNGQGQGQTANTIAALFGAPTNAPPSTAVANGNGTAAGSLNNVLSNVFTQPAQVQASTQAVSTVSNAGLMGTMGASESSGSSTETGGWFSWSNILIVILLLALLGINVFVYLAQGTTWMASWVKWFGGEAAETSGNILSTAGTGAKATVGAVAGATVGAVKGAVEGAKRGAGTGAGGVGVPRGNTASTQFKQSTVAGAASYPPPDSNANISYAGSDDSLQRALNDASSSVGAPQGDAPQPMEGNNSSGGWCFIGEMYPSGVRTCAKVGVNDTCMSGQVFPTQDVCVNPALRA